MGGETFKFPFKMQAAFHPACLQSATMQAACSPCAFDQQDEPPISQPFKRSPGSQPGHRAWGPKQLVDAPKDVVDSSYAAHIKIYIYIIHTYIHTYIHIYIYIYIYICTHVIALFLFVVFFHLFPRLRHPQKICTTVTLGRDLEPACSQ